MHGVVLAEILDLLNLAHHHEDGGGTSEEGIARALVGFPGIDEVRDAFLEQLAVDFDRIGHGDDSRARATGSSEYL